VLIKRAQREARRGTSVAALPIQAKDSLDRRSFLRRSGLAAGGLAALGTLSSTLSATLKPVRRRLLAQRWRPARTSARIARSAARSSQRLPMAYGLARSRDGTARSIAARTAARARPCETTC
jgi:hypothetical protein